MDTVLNWLTRTFHLFFTFGDLASSMKVLVRLARIRGADLVHHEEVHRYEEVGNIV